MQTVPPAVANVDGAVRLSGGGVEAIFDRASGLLQGVRRGERRFALVNGPRLVFARPQAAIVPTWLPIVADGAATSIWRLPRPMTASVIEAELDFGNKDGWAGFALDISADGQRWRTVFDGSRRKVDGERYVIPPQSVMAIRIRDPRRADGQQVAVKAVRLGYEAERFPAATALPVAIRTGEVRDPVTGETEAWLEAPGSGGLDRVRWTIDAHGVLTLDYGYELNGPYLYHGISFDAPLADVDGVRALVDGRNPVWRNRLHGGVLGVYDIAGKRGGLPDPATAGYFAGLRWATFRGNDGAWTIASAAPDKFLRIGTRPSDHPNTTADFPAGDISILGAIPGMGSKFIKSEDSGPTGQPAAVSGEQRGRLIFTWPDR